MTTRLRWLELTPDYRCNQRCVGCYAAQPDGPSMDARELLDALARGRRDGATSLWLGGGEPTLRRDLFATASAARRMGYTRIKLQTNGMLLAYPGYARRCADAGVTEVAFAIKGATAATHDAYTRTPGAHALLLDGVAAARDAGLALEGDLLVYRGNAAEIPAMVARYTPLGLAAYRVWLLSSTDGDVTEHVPRIADVTPHLTAARALGLSTRADFITSLHTPACTLPEADHAMLFSAADLALRVSNPGGHEFLLESSPMEGGRYLEGCARCRHRPRCGGLRDDYLAAHGGGEFDPVAA